VVALDLLLLFLPIHAICLAVPPLLLLMLHP
jgi:hypothetical protein